MIHITDSQTDKILGFIPEDEFWDDVHKKSIKDTLETFDFTTFADREYAEHLAKRNRIIIPDEDGKYVEFVIENTRKYRDSSGGLFVEVYTSATYIELAKAKVIKPQTLSSQTVSTAVSHAIGGTEWEAGNIADVGTKTFVIEEHTNPYSYLKRIASEFDLELHFRVEVAGNKVVRRYVDLVERVGMWRGREVEFGKDLIGIERKEDFSNIVTALIGLGPEREDGTRLEVFVEDKDALARWGRNGQHIIEVYEPQSTDQTMTEARLRELTQNELEKRINSTVEYTADIADLEKVPGLEHEKIRFGDTIRIKDTSFTPPLYLEARIHTVERSIKKNGYKTVTLGDYIEYTEEEVHAIWKQLQSEVRRRITAKQLYDYTYSKLIIDNKDDEVRTDVETYARTVASDAKNEAITYTNNTLEPIAVRIDNVEEDIKNHEELISKAQTDIIQAYNEIALRATKTELDTVNQSVEHALGEISTLAGIIQLRATKEEVNALTGRISTVESTIQLHADMIQSKIDDGQARSIFLQEAGSFTFDADQINFKGHVFGEDATFLGSIGTPMLTIGADDITGYEDFGLRIQTAQWLPDLDKPFKKTGYIEFNTLNNGLEIIRYDLNGNYYKLDGVSIDAKTTVLNGYLQVNENNRHIMLFELDRAGNIWHIEVNNGNFNIAETDVSNRFTIDTSGTIYTSNDIIFGNNTGRLVNDGGYGYLQTVNSEYRVTKFKSTTYIPIRAASFPSGSLEKYKTNIEKWKGSALEIIRKADIYKYQLKSDIADGRHIERYGLVIGDGYRTPKELIDGDGIEQYAMNSINMKAIQELDKEQQVLKSRIAWLEAENELLREKIKKLEGMVS